MNLKTIVDLLKESVNMPTNNLSKVIKGVICCTAIYTAGQVVIAALPLLIR